jgi:hypothetical protein
MIRINFALSLGSLSQGSRPRQSSNAGQLNRPRGPLTSVWIPTGNPRQPLARIWIDRDMRSFASPPQPLGSGDCADTTAAHQAPPLHALCA